jgi:hypothetical protein
MPRSTSALLLVFLAATPGPTGAQSAMTAGWTITSGDYTIYGHTDYTPAILVLPRIVWDTTHRLDSARVVDSVRAMERPVLRVGLAAGLTQWPEELYCTEAGSAAMQPLDPGALLARVQLAARCGLRLVIVPPRRFLTASGQNPGIFSVDSAKRLIDRYAAVLTPDSIRKYRDIILGLNLADDYGCTACWGGRAIRQAEIAEWADYARARLPGIALGVRVEPSWVAAWPALAPKLDYAWAQYHTRKGEAQAYYDKAATTAAQLGLRVVMGVNVENCYGPESAPCSAEDLERFGTIAVMHPGSCAFLNWRYEPARWEDPAVRGVWEQLFGVARERAGGGCGRVG